MKKSQNSKYKPILFSGETFYETYKDAEFLKTHVQEILSEKNGLKELLEKLEPGKIHHSDFILKDNMRLLIRKTGRGVVIESHEFTYNRLRGLTAAFAFEHREQYPVIHCNEAYALGLQWDNENKDKCRLYLSAVIGAEHFWNQFGYYPLICSLRKYKLKQIKVEPLLKMAKIKNNEGIPMGKYLMQRRKNAMKVWAMFPGSTEDDFTNFYRDLPDELTNLLPE